MDPNASSPEPSPALLPRHGLRFRQAADGPFRGVWEIRIPFRHLGVGREDLGQNPTSSKPYSSKRPRHGLRFRQAADRSLRRAWEIRIPFRHLGVGRKELDPDASRPKSPSARSTRHGLRFRQGADCPLRRVFLLIRERKLFFRHLGVGRENLDSVTSGPEPSRPGLPRHGLRFRQAADPSLWRIF